MCLLIFQYRVVPEAPLLVGFNREEFFGRPAWPPRKVQDSPRVMCGIDRRAKGTWLGVNEHRLLVAVTNRLKARLPDAPRSRGLLCRDLLATRSCEAAIALAQTELAGNRYAGVNLICADPQRAAVVYGDDRIEVEDIQPGLHVITNDRLDDPSDPRQALARSLINRQPPASAEQFIEISRGVLATPSRPDGRPGIVLRADDRGTVSSTLIAVTSAAESARYLYASGPPDDHPYADLSHWLRDVLAGK